MRTLLYWVSGSVLLGAGWAAICYCVQAWKRQADRLAALYG